MCDRAQKPLGIFDSGVGGLTVMLEVMRLLPNERIVYLADTAHLPYGTRSHASVRALALAACEKLARHDLKALVVACNTASICALEELTALFSFPVFGLIDAAVQEVLRVTSTGCIGLLATPRTIASQCYQRHLLAVRPDAQITAVACPLFVRIVEEQLWGHPATEELSRRYLAPLQAAKVDTILLGCTHYPFLQSLIGGLMPDPTLVHAAAPCAANVRRALTAQGLQAERREGPHRFLVTKDPARFKALVELFLGQAIDVVDVV